MIDNTEVEEIMNKLETLEDEALAVSLLREFNDKTKALGQLVMNLDAKLDNEEWKQQCDKAKKEVEEIVAKIRAL
jgi:hypothetical protein